MKTRYSCILLASTALLGASPAAFAAAAAPTTVADGIGGVVTGAKGPEAGVWVIAETEDLPTRLIKVVVTDDEGRFMLPQLPKASYKIWVRGYGLIDSQPVEGTPGKNLNLKSVVAPNAKEAAQYYPANYWLSLIEVPAANEFPGTGPKGNGIAPAMATQQYWTSHMKEGCTLCHQLGDKTTRELADNNEEGWAARISKAREDGDAAVGNLGHSYSHDMQNNMSLYGRARGLKMFADWTRRISAGDLPKEAPPRPAGVERNVVLTIWDWANGHQIHDEVSADRRNPTLLANGRVYGASSATGTIPWLDPVKNETGEIQLPGKNGEYDINAYPHNPMLDQKGRVWITDSTRGRQITSRSEKGVKIENPLGTRAAYCYDGSNKYSKYYPMPGENRSAIFIHDPANPQVEHIPMCFGIHHLAFAYDPANTLWFSGDSDVYGFINTKIWDETKDMSKAQGWCPGVVDTNGDGKITPDRTQWNKQRNDGAYVNFDAKKDTHIFGGGYGIDAAPKDGTIWYAKNRLKMPTGLVRVDPGKSPPETCISEYYEPPLGPDGKNYVAFDARGIGVDTNGIAHTTFGDGKIATLDRTKCKVSNGPKALGQHCPEGWTFYDIPGPRLGTTNVAADWYYLNWVDTYDTLGLGPNTPLTVGSNSDSLIALTKDKKVVHFRVPYPLGSFYSRGMDGRIDDPKAGWKGRGIWGSQGKFPAWHQEGGEEGRGPMLIKFQVRPTPLDS